ncbi:MAG TPA: class I SAM-dependent methyltransferase [Rhizomicrobium sp.]|nr:class I SAM-dependent methyltransferase [Rhizomicrobium sp.]
MAETPSIDDVARRIAEATGGFTGGRIDQFGEVGQKTLAALKQAGLRKEHHLLDVGCGTLRLGYWLIRFLAPERYCGLEPKAHYIKAGLDYAIGPELAAQKRPRFDRNEQFDFSVFGVTFDFVVARSIFSHASPEMVCRALESFRENSSENGVMLASYRPLQKQHAGKRVFDEQGDGEWSWRQYGRLYLQELARERGLEARNFGKPFGGQVWLRVSKPLI